ncbi:MAG: hypothetical protein Q8M58_12435 [Anaerolineales bacterium]|nr:hypothetical protein [Anaerolineales bacterium]
MTITVKAFYAPNKPVEVSGLKFKNPVGLIYAGPGLVTEILRRL